MFRSQLKEEDGWGCVKRVGGVRGKDEE